MQVKHKIALWAALLGSSIASQAIADQGNWVPESSNDGTVPFDAIVGGHERNSTPLSVCEAHWIDPRGFVTGPHPGQVRQGFSGCQITHHESNSAGQPETPFVTTYNVLVPSWKSASNGDVPPNAVHMGCDDPAPGQFCGPDLFVCRAPSKYGGGLHIGKVRREFRACFFEYGGYGEAVSPYEVLVDQTPKLPIEITPIEVTVFGEERIPADALVGGYEKTGEKLFICLASFHGGLHPGKTRPGFGGCNIEYGTPGHIGPVPGLNEVTVPTFSVLVPNWAPQPGTNAASPAYDFPIGKNGSASIYACHTSGLNDGSVHIGEWRIGWHLCHFGNVTGRGPEREYGPIQLLSSTAHTVQ